jgi:hypothetical protein
MDKVKIYSLSDPITNEVMYIGRTKARLSARLSSHYHCSRHNSTPRDIWIANLRNNNLKPIMKVIEDVEESIWREKEKYWISYYREINPNLTNLSEGGEGAAGLKRTEENIKTMSEVRSKPVYQLDLNFKIIKEYSSCKNAIKETSIPHISTSATNKGKKSAGGYVWIYKSDFEEFIKNEKRDYFKKDYSYIYKKIGKFDKSGKLLQQWESVKIASKETGLAYQNIVKAARGERKTYKKFIWKYL